MRLVVGCGVFDVLYSLAKSLHVSWLQVREDGGEEKEERRSDCDRD